MSRYIKSVPETEKLTKSLQELQQEFSYYKKAVNRNNEELSKMNGHIEDAKLQEMKKLEEKLKKLEMQHTQWVESSEPAIKVTEEYILKKLDIL